MIERLLNLEHPCKDPGYNSQQKQIAQLTQELSERLDETGKIQLNQLTDAYLKQEAFLLKDAFLDGFCAAIELAIDCLRHQS